MAAADRLSDLPDDLLAHILSFSPTREAARTTILSLNLDSRSYHTASRPYWLRVRYDDDVLADVHHALAFHRSAHPAARRPVKIALVMHDKPILLADVLTCFKDTIGELRVECLIPAQSPYQLGLAGGRLPIGTFRILDLAGCNLANTTLSSSSFPCLEALRLCRCDGVQGHLQDMINAAPKLVDLRLQSLSFETSVRLRCPTVAVLVMTNCYVVDGADKATIEVDAPRLHRLRYRYTLINTSVSLASPAPPALELVDLEVNSAAHLRSMLCSVSGKAMRVLKLTVNSIADVDEVVDRMTFPNLEHLQIEQVCRCLDNHGAAATAIVNMLCICPAVRELRLKFSWRKYLHESLDHDDPEVIARLEDLTSDYCSWGGGGGGGSCCGVPDGFKCGCKLNCLLNSLTSVAVEVEAYQTKLTCFQVQLLSFLERNAMLLEEIRIDGGNLKIERWDPRSSSLLRSTKSSWLVAIDVVLPAAFSDVLDVVLPAAPPSTATPRHHAPAVELINSRL